MAPDLPITPQALGFAVMGIVLLVAGFDLAIAAIIRAVREAAPDE